MEELDFRLGCPPISGRVRLNFLLLSANVICNQVCQKVAFEFSVDKFDSLFVLLIFESSTHRVPTQLIKQLSFDIGISMSLELPKPFADVGLRLAVEFPKVNDL